MAAALAFKGTPGPWEGIEDFDASNPPQSQGITVWARDPLAKVSGRLHICELGGISSEDAANAAAIAQVPAMVEAIKDLAEILPVAGRLHPRDLLAYQTQLTAILAALRAGGAL